jgi:hypothetical protein
MARRAMDEMIADYADSSKGEFKANELREFVRATSTNRRSPDGRYFDEGDVIIIIDDDQGIFMDNVKVMSKFGVGKIKRVTITMNTKPVS